MPSISKHFLAFGLAFALAPFALAPFASAVPLAAGEKQTQTGSFSGVSYETGIYNSSDPLSKRGTPSECLFGGRAGATVYRYIKLEPEEGTACVAFDDYKMTVCDQHNRWGIDEIGDILLAMNLIVTKDGWLSTSEAGKWMGNFELPTTVFGTRDTRLFVEGLVQIEKQTTKIWWRRNGDTAVIIRNDNRCE